MEDNEIFAAVNAEKEQSVAAMKDLAQMTGAFYRGLQEDGFSTAECLTLTSAFIAGMARGNAGGSE